MWEIRVNREKDHQDCIHRKQSKGVVQLRTFDTPSIYAREKQKFIMTKVNNHSNPSALTHPDFLTATLRFFFFPKKPQGGWGKGVR